MGKRLVINADDFGFTRDVNAGIIEAFSQGVLTSTTLMANGHAFDDAVCLARYHPRLDVGCHLVLVQGSSILTGKPLPSGPRQLLAQILTREMDVYSELRAQIDKILSTGIRSTHLDTHKHTHLLPRVFREVVRLAVEYSIPFVRLPVDTSLPFANPVRRFYSRLLRDSGVRTTDHFLGFRLTGSLNEQSFAAALKKLPDGFTEFMCHPGQLGSELRSAHTRLKDSRARELEALVSPRIRQLMDDEEIRVGPYPLESCP